LRAEPQVLKLIAKHFKGNVNAVGCYLGGKKEQNRSAKLSGKIEEHRI